MNCFCRILAALTICVSVAAVAAAAAPMERGVVEKLSNTPRAAEQSAGLKAAAAADDAAGLVARTRAVIDNSALTPVEREKLLLDAALGLRQITPDAAARALADELAHVTSEVLIWHGEGHHRVTMPRFDIAAAAVSANAAWDRQAARNEAAGKLAGGPAAFAELLDLSVSIPQRQLSGIEDAFRFASDATLVIWRDALLAALPGNRQLDGPAAVVASRLADSALFEALILAASEATVLANFEAMRASMPSGEALRLLALATQRAGLASASLLQVGQLAQTDDTAIDYLFARLSDRAHGGSAAAALAALENAAVTARLVALLENSADDVTRRRALLALRLSAGADALDALQRWQQMPARSAAAAALKTEAQAWIRR